MESMLYWGLGLLGVALLLVVVDIFVPSGGVLSLISITVAIAAVVCLFLHSVTWGLIGVLVVLVGGPVFFFIGLNVMPHTPIGRKLVLGNPGGEPEEGAEATPPPGSTVAGPDAALAALVGQDGLVVTDLRPIGVVQVGERRYDARSETTMVRAGQRVRITGVDGSELRVREQA